MEPRIETLPETKLVGKMLKMSFTENKTSELWQSFMPKKREIKNIAGNELYSVEIYDDGFFEQFDPTAKFEKWAAVKVSEFENLADFENLTIPAGLYAVFTYQGKSSEGAKFYQFIFADWIPKSEFLIDARPHFALMGEKYKNDSDDSEEEIWIPVSIKK